MREILFRGKTYNGEWVEGNFIDWGNHVQVYIFPLLEYATSYDLGTSIRMHAKAVIPETVGQMLTGFTDKNSNQIFEGDIVKCRHCWRYGRSIHDDTVEEFFAQKIRSSYGKYVEDGYWRKSCFYYRNYVVKYDRINGSWRLQNGSVVHCIGKSTLFNRDAEIIGNIHDNPELLERREG